MKAQIRNFNYTGRRRILWEQVRIRVENRADGGNVVLEILELQLDSDLPNDALVVLEVRDLYREISRYVLGTVGDYSRRVDTSTRVAEGMTITVKIIEAAGEARGKVLAMAEGLRPEGDNEANERSFVHFVPIDLGDRVWCINIDESRGPEIQVNSQLADFAAFTKNPLVHALVLPELVRHACVWAITNQIAEDSVSGGVLAHWRRFCEQKLGVDISNHGLDLDDSMAVDEWAQDVAGRFANLVGSRRIFEEQIRGVEE